MTFEVEVLQSEREKMREMIREETEGYLSGVYGWVEEGEVQREARRAAEEYLEELYEEVGRREEEEEEKACREVLSEYVRELSDSITTVAAQWPRKKAKPAPTKPLPVRRQEKRTSISCECPQQQKAFMIEAMVSRSLQEMLPSMVSELTARIMGNLRKMGQTGAGVEMNPEEL